MSGQGPSGQLSHAMNQSPLREGLLMRKAACCFITPVLPQLQSYPKR